MSDNQIINGSHVALIALIVLGIVAVLIGLILGIQVLIKKSENYDIFVARPLEQSGVNRLDWRTNAIATCSRNNAEIPRPPRSTQDCPDSSFAYVNDLSYYVGAKNSPSIPGCIQLNNLDDPFCYNDAEGKYKPWMLKNKLISP